MPKDGFEVITLDKKTKDGLAELKEEELELARAFFEAYILNDKGEWVKKE